MHREYEFPMKEALYYKKLNNDFVQCLLCPKLCKIKEGKSGFCGARENIGNKLFSNIYSRVSSEGMDPIEKKPLYHFIPGSKAFSIATAGCNLACLNCQNWTISQFNPYETKNMDLMPDKVVEQCLNLNCEAIAFTYTEPLTFFEYSYDTAKLAKAEGIKTVLVSAGYVHEEPFRDYCKYIDAANIDLKSFSEDIYLKLNAGKLSTILQTLKICKEENVWLEITNLVVPGWTDDLDMIKEMCDWLYADELHEYPLHFSRFHPQHKLKQVPATPVSILEKAREIAIEAGIKYVYIGNVPGHSACNTICPKCKKIVIERRGYRIMNNYIQNNSCKFCKEKISGVWE